MLANGHHSNWVLKTHLCTLLSLLTLGMAFSTARSAQAKEPWQPSEDIFGWAAPPPEVQLELDQITVPEGMGAIFLPAMTTEQDHPEVLVFRRHERVAAGSFGERIVVRPGSYTIRVGSGSIRQTVSIEVDVQPNETVLVDPVWGGLRIEVVDANSIPHRGGYELIQAASRDVFGIGYGADSLLGERPQTWILPPGLYRVVQPGSTYRARTNFATVYVPEGALVRYQLVMDPETREFLGAGIVTGEELSVPEAERAWLIRLVLGLNGNLAISDMAGTPSQTSASGEAFLDSTLSYSQNSHHIIGLLQVEEGLLWINPDVGDALPLQKTRDRVRLDLLYRYDIYENLGPYVRAGARLSVFPSRVITTTDVSIARNYLDGRSERIVVSSGDSFLTSGYLGEVLIWEGVGVNWRVLRSQIGQLDIGFGVGLRQGLYTNFWAEHVSSSQPEIVYEEIENFFQEGFESILRGNFRLTSIISYTTYLELFTAFEDISEPNIDWQNTLSLRLLEFMTLDYRFDLLRQPQVTEDLQTAHNILLRFSWEII